ncbi:MAG: nucleoside phosphorylase [Bacteroidales bacterium]|nr:nucleoside phosphorylase [Bacteroidales bacterium]MDD4384243.1 nucleoside phosphorylase [Bacteroidales bacterium]MDY0197427.1 nucleoside phosphorylase [Tenuifilaceae bacterium]
MRIIEPSELILNPNGSIFHLHLKPEDVADKVILVGDPGRVDTVAKFFSKIELTVSNREFKTTTGFFNGKRISVVSTGIGTDNIDIVVNELDALVNIDLEKRQVKEKHRQLTIVRLGTSGALQADIPVDCFVSTNIAVGFDGLLNFYDGRNRVSDLAMEAAFLKHTNWKPLLAKPYFVHSNTELVELFKEITVQGVTISAPGFYGPQGRVLRLPLADSDLNNSIESFRYNDLKITNFEMESSAINGLSLLLGHSSITICAIIANRILKTASADYKSNIKKLIEQALQRLTK